MARQKTPDREPPALKRPIFIDRFNSVPAASWGKPTIGTQKWGDGTLVKPDDSNKKERD